MRSGIFALALLFAGAVFAQTPAPAAAPDHGARMMEDLTTLLDLTDAQKVQVQAILQQEHAQMRELFEQAKASGTKPDFNQMHALHAQAEQDTLQKLTPVLSATQLKKFKVLASMHHGGQFHHHGPPPGAPPAQE